MGKLAPGRRGPDGRIEEGGREGERIGAKTDG